MDVSSDHRPGYFKDKYGEWQRDRRKGGDRRKKNNPSGAASERRMRGRRIDDRDLEREHNHMIEEALEEFVQEDPSEPETG